MNTKSDIVSECSCFSEGLILLGKISLTGMFFAGGALGSFVFVMWMTFNGLMHFSCPPLLGVAIAALAGFLALLLFVWIAVRLTPTKETEQSSD